MAKNFIPSLAVNLRDFAILLDVDGTILDIAPTPDGVRAPASLRGSLARLSRMSGGALALVSGRSIGDLDRIFSPLRLPAIGGHGAEFRPRAVGDADRSRVEPLDPELRRRLAAVAVDGPGILVEDKGFSLALHYRLAPEQERRVKDSVAAIHAGWVANSVEVLPGKAVVEVKSTGFDKGAAIRRLMEHLPFAGRRPIFVGDDTTDDAAFAVLSDFDGIGISVGRTIPGVAHRFDTPREVRRWLQQISEGDGSRAP